MKRTERLFVKSCILMLAVVLLVAGVIACGKPATNKTTEAAYKLTHSAADAEYVLSWDSIVSQCPDIREYDKQEVFIRRGETLRPGTGETLTLDIDSPMAWSSQRFIQKTTTGEKVRNFGVWTIYFDTDEYLDEFIELMKMQGFPFQEEGEFVTGIVEAKASPTMSVQLILAGDRFCLLFLDVASSDESFFFGKEKLMEFLPTVKSNITSLEITPLPAGIAEREKVDTAPGEWQEFMKFRSEEVSPPVRVPEEQHYNDLIFGDRPLMQVFNFTMDKSWRFVMTAAGETDTRFEVYITVTSPGEQGLSYSSDHVFSLHSQPLTIIREEPLEEKYTPPVDIEVKVFFDFPMSWTFTIEK